MKKIRYFIVRALPCFFFRMARKPNDTLQSSDAFAIMAKKQLIFETDLEIRILSTLCSYELRLERIRRRRGLCSISVLLILSLIYLPDIVSAQENRTTVGGRILDTQKLALPGATIRVSGEKRFAISDKNGDFTFDYVLPTDTLVIFSIGFKRLKLLIGNKRNLGELVLATDDTQLMDVEIVSTGYQQVPRERATGSFVQIDNKLINRRISTNILDRLEGITSGLSFNRNTSTVSGSNPSTLSVRGRSTIFANPNPLIVVDNFPFNGNLSSINPNDIATITVLKDAAAASIWGALSGNGVIVITTKRGKAGTSPKVAFSTNLTLAERPDLYQAPRLSSSSFIEIEKFLFDKGYYNARITSTARPVLSPVVELLVQLRTGQINSAQAEASISGYAKNDTRGEQSKYLYQNPVSQQYSLGVSGGGENNTYYLSAGLDRNVGELKRNNFGRINISGINTVLFSKKKLEWTTALYYSRNRIENNGLSTGLGYPYLKLKNDDGSNASIAYLYRKPYVDTLGNGKLLDWKFRPLNELELNDNATTLTEYRMNTSLKYTIISGLDASVQYQYNQGNDQTRIFYDQNRFYTRDYINRYTQISSTGVYTRLVPLGGILDNRSSMSKSQNLRGQLSLNKTIGEHSNINAIIGMEGREVSGDAASYRLYGYNEAGAAGAINFQGTFPTLPANANGRIESGLSQLSTTNRYISTFSNASYTYLGRYILSVSARKDESNVFGASTNQKGIPLWSVGGSWEISREQFYKFDAIPYLRLRLTKGYQGNVDNSLSPQVTVTTNPLQLNIAGSTYSVLSNPPNPDLRWEKIGMLNIGMDFRGRGDRLQGTLEFFSKSGRDLIGVSMVDPTTGVKSFKGNSADMDIKGLDLTLNSKNITGRFNWSSVLLMSLANDKVTKYLLTPPTVSEAVSGGLNPIVGNPLYSIYALEWAGLDAAGNPQILIAGQPSINYSAILGSTDASVLKYIGPVNPPLFGSLRNDFNVGNWNLSVNITYKFGNYFRNPGLAYGNIFSGNIAYTEQQYQSRWKMPGDELTTNVPSMIYPANSNRDMAYNYSTILIEKGDHIRLQDINIGYDFSLLRRAKKPFRSLRVFAYLNNIGILWRANKLGVDPDFLTAAYSNPRSYAIGITAGL